MLRWDERDGVGLTYSILASSNDSHFGKDQVGLAALGSSAWSGEVGIQPQIRSLGNRNDVALCSEERGPGEDRTYAYRGSLVPRYRRSNK